MIDIYKPCVNLSLPPLVLLFSLYNQKLEFQEVLKRPFALLVSLSIPESTEATHQAKYAKRFQNLLLFVNLVAVDSLPVWNLFFFILFVAGQIPALNDIIKRGLAVAGIPSVLESPGLDRCDGKKTDGIAVFPFEYSRTLVWNAIFFGSFDPNILLENTVSPGSVFIKTEAQKIKKLRFNRR